MGAVVLDDKRQKPLSPRDKRRIARQRFQKPRKVAITYERQLRQVAKQVGVIVNGLAPGGIVTDMPAISEAMARYSSLIEPWAKAVAGRMIVEVAQRDERAWIAAGREMGLELRGQIRRSPIGVAVRELMELQVELIKSIPIEAAERVHKLTIEALSSGTRAAEVAEMIRNTTGVTQSRAMLIARTESSRAASVLTEVRAEHIGSVAYTWETAEDLDVRQSHAAMQGKIVRWDQPPTLDGLTGHAGALPNCRCWPNPIIPDKIR